jgi:PAT family beta-lactamase induction signal transducer AmpG
MREGVISNHTERRIWLWVFAGFLFQTIPAAIRDEALPVALKNAGVTNHAITRTVSLLGFIVALKIFWAPILTLWGRTRASIIIFQSAIVSLLFSLAYFISPSDYSTLAIATTLALLSLCSAAHDFLLDGYYVSSLNDSQRAKHSGLLSFSSKLGQVLAGPGVIWLAGYALTRNQSVNHAWSSSLCLAAVTTLLVGTLMVFGFKNEPAETANPSSSRQTLSEILSSLSDLLRDKRTPALIGLILFYRLSEVHLIRIVPLFSLDSHIHGGLELNNEQYAGMRLATAILGLALGGIIGSWIISKRGLAKSILPLGVSMHLPLLAVTWLSFYPNQSLFTVGAIFLIEYIAFGAGICALLLAMMQVANGKHAAVRYALLSTIAVLSVYIPGLWAGSLSDKLGYPNYFILTLFLAIPGLISAYIAQEKLKVS